MERLDEYRIARRVLMAEVSGGRVWGRPMVGWMDGWCEGDLGQQRDDGGGCSEKSEEPWCIC